MSRFGWVPLGAVTGGAASVSSLNVNNGGLTNVGTISGATSITGSSLSVSGARLRFFPCHNEDDEGFDVMIQFMIMSWFLVGVSAGALSSDAASVSSMNVNNGGITNAGAISGATSVTTSSLSVTGSHLVPTLWTPKR
jgi:hypothetical protein